MGARTSVAYLRPFLDADEALDDTLKQSILELKTNWKYDGYKMDRLTNYCGKWIRHTGWYPIRNYACGIIKRDIGRVKTPHDEFKLFDEKASIAQIDGDILHYSYHHPEDHDKQIAYFTDIAPKHLLKKVKSPFLCRPNLSAFLKFIKCYFIKLGFLDGKEGWILVKVSYAAYLKYKKINTLLKRDS